MVVERGREETVVCVVVVDILVAVECVCCGLVLDRVDRMNEDLSSRDEMLCRC